MTTDFGTDSSCATSLVTGRMVSGGRLVAEAAFRRLTTPRGMLRGGEEEQNYGLDLLSLIGSTDPANTAASLPAQIAAELVKDPRIISVSSTVGITRNGPATEYEI